MLTAAKWTRVIACVSAVIHFHLLSAPVFGEVDCIRIEADVIIAGGSTAAFSAAVAAADSGAKTVLIEPTDWPGGQLTSSGVPAVDEAWHRIRRADGSVALDVAGIARHPPNMPPRLRDMLFAMGNPGKGWVSRFCFLPQRLLDEQLLPLEERLEGRLSVFRETVVKRLVLSGNRCRIEKVEAIQRFPREGRTGYEQRPSEAIRDWYSPVTSARFRKQPITFAGRSPAAVFIDATEWGELLVLSGFDYLQGVDADESHDPINRCGQCTVFGIVQEYLQQPKPDPCPDVTTIGLGWGKYQGRADVWEKVWTYRRPASQPQPAAGDLTLQNWGYSLTDGHGGNDYPFGYLFQSANDSRSRLNDWTGGVDLEVMSAAETRAYAWHRWVKSQSPKQIEPARIVMSTEALGTEHGLSKLPYIRDTRRSIGLDRFRLKGRDLEGASGNRTGREFADAIAIGCYPVDIHPLANCAYPPSVTEHRDTRPFYIPFRALTHYQIENLLVCGKTMAQDFGANAATRLHPIEWSTGTAAGTAAAWMVREQATSRQALDAISAVQAAVQERTPIEWTFPKATGSSPP